MMSSSSWRESDGVHGEKRIITNDLRIRWAARELNDAATFDEICARLAEALQPIGFDGMGFRLPTGYAVLPIAGCGHNNDGQLQHFWHGKASETVWSLSIALLTSRGTSCGQFFLHRHSTAAPLLVDTNVFTDEFRMSLADAIARIIQPEEKARRARASVYITAPEVYGTRVGAS